MKKISLLLILLFIMAVGFPQIIQDPLSGLKMELSNDSQYLTIIYIKAGSPADLVPLNLGDRIYSVNSQPVSAVQDWNEFFRSSKDNSMQFQIRRFNEIKSSINIQRGTVDFLSDNILSESGLFQLCFPVQLRLLSKDISTEKEMYDKVDEIIQSTVNPRAYAVSQSGTGIKFCYYNPKLNSGTVNEISILGDESKNLSDFKTFDFDYTSTDESLLEKNLLNKLEKHLTILGLVRNTTNPDILIIINFYAGQKEQYVPPQQIISTKIQSYFNWYWGYIPVPVTESKTKDGYTKVTYITSINLKMLDSKEISSSKVPPVLWSASYMEVSPEKVFISDYADRIFSYMLLQFPKVITENCKNLSEKTYTYTGNIYDKLNPSVIADVLPGSPAYLAGLRKGDVIVKISDRKLPDEITPATLSFMWQNRSDYDNALKYLFMQTDLKSSPTGLFRPLKSDYEDYQAPAGTPVIFEIKRSGKKMEFNVVPEFKRVVFFGNTGFTL